jgi:hypothetical protein
MAARSTREDSADCRDQLVRIVRHLSVTLYVGFQKVCRVGGVDANGQYEYRLVRAHSPQSGQHLESIVIGHVDSDDYQIPRLAERQIETFRPGFAFAKFQRLESLGEDLPDPSSNDGVVVENENS